MHEVGLMERTLDLACAQARTQGAPRILVLHLRVGPLSGVVPEALAFAFEALAPDTLAAGARLEIEHAPVKCYCSRCDAESALEGMDFACPRCGQADVEIRQGTELELTAIEID